MDTQIVGLYAERGESQNSTVNQCDTTAVNRQTQRVCAVFPFLLVK